MKSESSNPASNHQPSGLDQIDDFRYPISWLSHANSPVPAEEWLRFMACIWSNPARDGNNDVSVHVSLANKRVTAVER